MYISDLFGHFIDELEYIVTVAGIAVLALTALILRANRQNFSTPIAFAAGGIVVRYDREVVAEGFQSIGQALVIKEVTGRLCHAFYQLWMRVCSRVGFLCLYPPPDIRGR